MFLSFLSSAPHLSKFIQRVINDFYMTLPRHFFLMSGQDRNLFHDSFFWIVIKKYAQQFLSQFFFISLYVLFLSTYSRKHVNIMYIHVYLLIAHDQASQTTFYTYIYIHFSTQLGLMKPFSSQIEQEEENDGNERKLYMTFLCCFFLIPFISAQGFHLH